MILDRATHRRLKILELLLKPKRPPRPRLNTDGTAWRIETYIGRGTIILGDRPRRLPPRKESV